MYDLFYSSTETPASVKNQGNALLSEGRIADAERMYRKAISLNPRYMPAYYNLGNVLRMQRRFEEALTAYETALSLSPDDYEIWMNKGATLIELGRPAEARQAFSRAHELMPTAAEALVNMGLACERQHQIEKSQAAGSGTGAAAGKNSLDAAVDYYNKALAINPGLAVAHSNLGSVLQSQGKPDAAEQSLRRAIELNPDFADAQINLGNALQSKGQLEEAAACFQRAIKLSPENADAFYNLGNVYRDLKRAEEAEASYRKALAINPRSIGALSCLAGLLMERKRSEEALGYFRQVIEIEPGNAVASHMIASLTKENSEAAPAQYVAELFDGFARNFEESLVQNLNYAIPQKLAALLADVAKPGAREWDILDLGCGTGLVGTAIAPYARQLVGVDLSTGMLEKAKEKNLYQRLEKADLLTMMKEEPSASYHVVVAADVFVYIGKLDAIMAEIKRLLRPGGMLAFSVEAAENQPIDGIVKDYCLNQMGRYAHSSAYIETMAAEHGLRKRILTPSDIRLENGAPVQGWVVLLENAGA